MHYLLFEQKAFNDILVNTFLLDKEALTTQCKVLLYCSLIGQIEWARLCSTFKKLPAQKSYSFTFLLQVS